MSGPTLKDALAAAQRGEAVTVTLDAKTLETLARFWERRQQAWQARRPGRDVPLGYRRDPELGRVLRLAAGDAEKSAWWSIEAAALSERVER